MEVSNEPSATTKLLLKHSHWLVMLAALIPGIGALGGPFFYIDDHAMIDQNPMATGPLSLNILTTPHFQHYAPLHELLIWMQWHLFGDAPTGFRIISLLLHACAAWACLVMLRNLTQRPLLALGATLVWAMHPIQPESVAWIAEQKTLLCGLFCFLSLGAYFDLKRPRTQRVLLGVLLMIVGCFAKSPALIVGPVVLLYELLAISNYCAAQSPAPRSLLSAVPFLIVSAIFAKVALWANGYSESVTHWTKKDTLLHLPGALLIYFRVAFLPWTASFFQELDRVAHFDDTAFWGKLAALLYFYMAGLMAVRHGMRRLFVFCAFAWVLALGPMLNISLWTFPAYDRFQYMALPFLIVGAALIVDGLVRMLAPRISPQVYERSMPLAWSAMLGVVAILGFCRGALFANEANVMADAVKKSPGNAYSSGQFAHALYPEWVRASSQHRFDEQKKLARDIAEATSRAQRCWNFAEFYVTPVPLLAMTGQVLHESGMGDAAVPYLEAAISEPRWTRFKQEREVVRRRLAVIALDFAQSRIQQAESKGTPADVAQELARIALQDVERSRELAGASDTGSWWTFKAHEILAGCFRKNGQNAKSDEERRAAEAALMQIEPRSKLYALATNALKALKQ